MKGLFGVNPFFLASELQRPVSWEVDFLTCNPCLKIHLSLVGMLKSTNITGNQK